MPRHLMVCFSGWASSGKDACSTHIVQEYGAYHTGLADPGKRHMHDTYGFTSDQLWGPSSARNTGDMRYPKFICEKLGLKRWNDPHPGVSLKDSHNSNGSSYLGEDKYSKIKKNQNLDNFWYTESVRGLSDFGIDEKPCQLLRLGEARYFVRDGDPDFWLSPRECLQKYMDLMNSLYLNTWIQKGIEVHKKLALGSYSYSRMNGLSSCGGIQKPLTITCFSDFRHIHEHKLAKQSMDSTLIPVLIRIKRPEIKKPPFEHRSETEQTRIKDSAYDFVIQNNSSIENLYSKLNEIIKTCSDPKWIGVPWDESNVLEQVRQSYAA